MQRPPGPYWDPSKLVGPAPHIWIRSLQLAWGLLQNFFVYEIPAAWSEVWHQANR